MSVTLTSSLDRPTVAPLTTAPLHTYHTWLLRDAIARSAAVREFRDYYAGKQPNALSDAQKTMLAGLILDTSTDTWDTSATLQGGGLYLCDNVTKIIVNRLRGRTKLKGFACEDNAVQQLLDDAWIMNALGDLQSAIHRDTYRDGDSYALLGWDEVRQRVTVTRHPQWVQEADGSTFGRGVHLVYDDDGQPLLAIKEWVEEVYPASSAGPAHKRRRRTLYYRDRLERYAIDIVGGVTQDQDWRPYLLPGEDMWPMPWAADTLPVVAFPNEGDDSRYGVSELAGDILGKQRVYNDQMHAFCAAYRMTGYGMITATGVQASDAAAWKVGPAQVLGTANADARIGKIDAATLEPNISAMRYTLQSISHSADMPMHHLTGEWPSGEALMRAELPFTNKVRDRQERLTQPWASLMHKLTLIQRTFGPEPFGRLNTEAVITPLWEDPALRDEKYLVEIVALKSQWLSTERILTELHYTPEQIAQIMREMAADEARRLASEQALASATAAPATDG